MLKKTLRYLWGQKSLVIIVVLVIFLLPNIISRELQVRTVPVITKMTIEVNEDIIKITAEKLKANPGAQTIEYDTAEYTGTDVREILKDVSLAHCTDIHFTDSPDITILQALYNYQDLRANTKINHDRTIDEILKTQLQATPME